MSLLCIGGLYSGLKAYVIVLIRLVTTPLEPSSAAAKLVFQLVSTVPFGSCMPATLSKLSQTVAILLIACVVISSCPTSTAPS